MVIAMLGVTAGRDEVKAAIFRAHKVEFEEGADQRTDIAAHARHRVDQTLLTLSGRLL